MIEVGLFDGTFSAESMGFGEENLAKSPTYIKWVRNEYRKTTVFTDMYMNTDMNVNDEVKSAPTGTTKIAWLIEPMCFSDTAYRKLRGIQSQFDFIISHDLEYISMRSFPRYKAFWCPVGGSWIAEHGMSIYKTKGISFITTAKNTTIGHHLRRAILDRGALHHFGVDCFGAGATPLERKAEALRDYKYSIVVESCHTAGYFTEKLTDCLSQGTIPIYWGAPDINHYFDPDGIIQFENFDELCNILVNLNKESYQDHMRSITGNAVKAKLYYCPEDYAYINYPWLFR